VIYFLIAAPIWLLCIFVGLVALCFPKARFTSTYILLGSTFGLVVSCVSSLLLLVLTRQILKIVGLVRLQWLAGVAYVVGFVAGGTLGIVIGSILADHVNRKLGWRLRIPKDLPPGPPVEGQ
jgi:hypothetical protein